jgi:signal peptidase II
VCLLLCCCGVGSAQEDDPNLGSDRVTVQQAGRTSRITVTGDIQDYTGRGLILKRRSGGGLMRYSRDEVIDVVTSHSRRHIEGRKLLAEGRIAEADAAFTQALDEEDRTWVRRDILASQVKCALWRGDDRLAAQRFLHIVDSDSDTLYFGLMPLVWQEQPSASVVAAAADARRWLQGPSDASRLIGASWLAHGGEKSQALLVLRTLSSAPQPNIQRYAQMQLWRARLDAGDVTAAELRRWVKLVEDLAPDLRAGPMFVIGRGYELQRDDLNAAAAFLWLPFEHPHLRDLASEAQARAAEALLRAGDRPAATQQAREVLARFPDSVGETRAKALQQRLSTESP